MLGPGDLLFVPRHWWHHVDALTHSVSVNTWIPHPRDHRERVSEALVRVLVSALHGALSDPTPASQKRHKADGHAVGGHSEGAMTDETVPSPSAAGLPAKPTPPVTMGAAGTNPDGTNPAATLVRTQPPLMMPSRAKVRMK